jgi:glycerol-3-phosphate responsive antiterminator
MQKLVNVVALLSGLVSIGVVGGGAYLFLNKDALIESARTKAIEEVTKTVTEALPGMVKSAIPSMPSATGDVMSKTNVPSVTGGVIPVK